MQLLTMRCNHELFELIIAASSEKVRLIIKKSCFVAIRVYAHCQKCDNEITYISCFYRKEIHMLTMYYNNKYPNSNIF